MKRSESSILTTHVGSLPRPEEVVEFYRARLRGEAPPEPDLPAAVAQVVRQQHEAGIDIVTDGEYGKEAWWAYADDRLAGLEAREPKGGEADRPTRERMAFPGYYAYYESQAAFALRDDWGRPKGPTRQYYCVGPISYAGHAQVQRDIDNLKSAMRDSGKEEGFLPAVSPFIARTWNEFYRSEDEFHQATADALNEEYRAIVNAGLLVQIDDPGLPAQWNSQSAPTLDDYRKRAEQRVELVNYALRGIPEDRVRYHICWGSAHGPHVHDLPLRDVVDLLLKVRAQAYSVEAGNVRHEHEWKVWKDVKLPDGKILIPGVVSHTTDTVEHPEVVADRIVQYASVVGRENVIAGTDCGLGGRVHPEVAWAKLHALGEGAALASKELWPK